MKKKLLIIFFIVAVSLQSRAEAGKDSSKVIPSHKNLFKINVPALALRTYAVEYERAIGKKIALSLGYRYMPKGTVPLKNQIINAIDDPEVEKQLNNFTVGNNAFTPQIKFYFGKDIFKGFYLAPFAKFATYSAKGNIDFDVNGTTETMPLDGELKTMTGGLELGVQFKLGKAVHFGFHFGPQFGTSEGNFDGKKTLDANEQQALRNELENLEIPFTDKEVTVDANGARVKLDGPWGGIKAGIMLGIRF